MNFTKAALENIEETGTSWKADLGDLLRGAYNEEELLARRLEGADEDRVQGWRDYVSALVAELS